MQNTSDLMWFRIKDRADLERVCNCYQYWLFDVKHVDDIEKRVHYPDYIGLNDCNSDNNDDGANAAFCIFSEIMNSAREFLGAVDQNKL